MRRFLVLLFLFCFSVTPAHGELIPMAQQDDPVEFTVFIRDNSLPPSSENPVIRRIQELTGVTLNFDFLKGDLDRTIDVMIATHNYPDAVFAYPQKFITAGAYIPLETLIEQYCPHLREYYDPWWEQMKAEDGHIYVLELFGVEKHMTNLLKNDGPGFWMQKRVLEFGGYPIPRTLDEYFDLIERYLEVYPEMDGEKNIGFAVLCDGWLDFCLRNPPLHLMGAGNEGDAYVDPETHEVRLYQNSEAAYLYYRKLNEEYHRGVLSAETMMQSADQYLQLIASGRVLGMFDQRWNYSTAEAVLSAAGRYDLTYVSLPVTLPGVQDGYLDAPASSFTGNNGLGITVACKDPVRLLRFYDWLIQEDVQTYLYWGEKDRDYTVDAKGRYHLTEERRQILQDDALRRNQTGFVLANYSPKMQGLYREGGNACEPADQVEEYRATLSAYDRAFLDAYGFQSDTDFLSPPVQRPASYPVWSMLFAEYSEAQIAHDTLVELCRKYDPRLILCPEGEYEAVWKEFTEAVESADLEPYLEEVQLQVCQRLGISPGDLPGRGEEGQEGS